MESASSRKSKQVITDEPLVGELSRVVLVEKVSLLVLMEHCIDNLVNYLAFKKNPNKPKLSMLFKEFKDCDFSVESKRLIK